MNIATIPTEDMPAQWPSVGPLIYANQIAHGRTMEEAVSDLTEIGRGLFLGSMQAWTVHNNGILAAICFTQRDGDAARVFCMVGSGARAWARPLCNAIAEFARANGCARIRFTGRPGWRRFLPEFQPVPGDGQTFERIV